MILSNPRNPRWSSSDSIELDVDTEKYGAISMNTRADDTETAALFEAAQRGDYGSVQPYVIDPILQKELKKQAVQDAIQQLTVKIGELVFDADETSIARMNNQIQAANLANVYELPWKLANNTTVIIPVATLASAFTAASLQFSNLILGNING